jgi:FkbM family methyltransferase
MVLRTNQQLFLRRALDFSGSQGELKREFLRFLVGSKVGFQSASFGDAFAAFILGPSRTFIELGAWEPVNNSETWALETHFGWKGAQVEPNPDLAKRLRSERETSVYEAAVIPESSLAKTAFLNLGGGSDTGETSERRTKGTSWRVSTISWAELIQAESVPHAVFIDIEGAELEVLRDILKLERQPDLVVVETLFNRDAIFELMLRSGLHPSLEELSGYNTWFLKEGVVEAWAARA